MKQKKRFFMLFGCFVLALVIVALPLISALAIDTMPAPIDPQSWKFSRDMIWDDWHDNTAFNWRIDGDKITPSVIRKGLLVLVDFVDRPFIVTSPTGAEQMGNPQIGGVPTDELVEFWESFLNDPEDHYNDGLNRGITISEFWQENTQGRWKVELDAVGVYRLPGYEFEYGLDTSMNSSADMPAGFTRRGSMNTPAINAAIDDGVDLSQYDFAFILHSGAAESQVWEEAGYMMFFDQQTVDDFYSARYRVDKMAAAGIDIPDATWAWLDLHDPANGGDGRGWWASTRYVPWTSWWAATAVWSSTSSINVGGRSFRLSLQGETNGNATFSHEFGHIVTIGDNYGSDIEVRCYTGFWDLMCAGSMTGFGGSHTRYQIPNLNGGAIPAHMLSRTKRKLGLIDDSQLTSVNYASLSTGVPVVTEIYARTTPIGDQFEAIYPDTLGLINKKVEDGQAAIGLRLYNFTDQKPRILSSVDWESDTFSGANRYDNYTMEVVQQVGYDSIQNDSGVLIVKNRETLSESAPYSWVVDAHAGGLDTVDFYTPKGPNGEPSVPQPFRNNDNNHLAAALFHAGKSVTPNDYGVETVRTGQTNATYSVVLDANGNVIPKSIADNTVNEYVDTYNRLHFYILDKMYSPGPYGGDILSYQVAVRHFDGLAVGGELEAELTAVEPESLGRVAVAAFDITNTGDATDIIRVNAEGMGAALLNDLYAIGAGETITVPVYAEITLDILTKELADQAIVFTASSESNGAKVATVSVEAKDLVIPDFTIYLESEQNEVLAGDTLYVNVMLVGDANYTRAEAVIAFDSDLLEYTGYSDLNGWVGEVTKTDNTVKVQSVPNMNLYIGAPCATPVKLVRLKLTAKDDFIGDSVDTDLIIESVVVNPQLGAIGKTAAAGDPLTITIRNPVKGTLSGVNLITGQELEIIFDGPVLSEARAKATFDIRVDGVKVDWEYLSYFDFGPYAELGGVVNVRLKEALDAGEPRGRRRESAAETYLNRTEHIKGPEAAARITVAAGGGASATAVWKAFYMERTLGNMSRLWTYASAEAGNNGTQLLLDNPNNYTSNNIFVAGQEPLYTDEYVARQVGEGMNRFVGRSEYMNLPMIDSGFKALLVGPAQSVYEVPEYRDLYKYGETNDTYTRRNIKATDVPGNFDPATGEYKRPFIVGTSDDILRHDSPMNAAGEPAAGEPARPKEDFFYFGEAFFDIYWELGMVQGAPRFPLTVFNDADDYRYDLHVADAYEKAKAAGLWPGTVMMDSLKNYYVYGAMTFWELVPESQNFMPNSWPINTRAEIYEYDYPLYWAMSGAHGKYEFWTGVGAGQALTSRSDNNKLNTPWFWWNQPDNFGLPSAADPTIGVVYPPLAIESVTIISHNLVEVKFNREIRTIQAVTTPANFKLYLDDREVPVTDYHGYGWKSIRLNTGVGVNFSTGLVTSGSADNRLDNGKPYGRYFAGFTQKDIDERKVSAGGWIADTQQPGVSPLQFGQFVGLDEAINIYGAGPAGKVEVAYVGGAAAAPQVLDWSGNELQKDVKYTADFKPWIGNAYRSPLTGYYIYLDTNVASHDFYMYTRKGIESNVTAKDIAMAAAHTYETQLTNNQTITYPTSAGGAAFDHAFAVGSGSRSTYNAGASSSTYTYTWNDGTVTFSGQNITNGPVTYDRVGQRIADGAVRGNGGMLIAAGSVLGNHPGRQPQSSGLATGVADGLRVEGWGGNIFQTEDVLVIRDYNLCRYKNESLVLHEGGHGIDSFAGGSGNYAQSAYNDITAAWATAVSLANGAKFHDVDGIGAYMSVRIEYVSTWAPWYGGGGRESFQGINDGTWTPIAYREEAFRYDPWGGEAIKRVMFGGELGLWYEGKIGDPDYRVMVEDWELLRDQNPQFSHWTSENDLIAWGFSTNPTALDNPYTGTHNDLIRWVSWRCPSVWNPEPYKEPSNPSFPDNRFDFVGRSAYHPAEDGGSPIEVETHPFLADGGVKKPERPAEIEALVKPIAGKVDDGSIGLVTPVVVQFQFEKYSDEITRNNAQTSFELYINGQRTHFYFWAFKETSPGLATVELRLEWPIESDDVIEIKAVATPAPSNGVTVNFPGITDAEVRYYTNVSGWQTVGVFDGACNFEIPAEHKATWGTTTVQVLKGGMWYTFSGLDVGDEALVLDVPLKTITLTGIVADCDLGLAQEDWIYRSAAAAAGATVEYLVFDNGKGYIIHLNKTGVPTIQIPDIAAGQTVDLTTYF